MINMVNIFIMVNIQNLNAAFINEAVLCGIG